MKTQEQIRAEFDRLIEEDRLEEAEILIEQIIPVSQNEFRRRLAEAPYDDEPVTPEQQQRIDQVHEMLAGMRARPLPGKPGEIYRQLDPGRRR